MRSPRRTLFVAFAMTVIATISAPAGAGPVASIGETTNAVTVWNANAGDAAVARASRRSTTRCTRPACTP